MKAFFYIQTLLLAAAIYFSTTYLNNGLLRYFPEECDSVLVANLDSLRRVKGTQNLSASLSKVLMELSSAYQESNEMLPISAMDQISFGEINSQSLDRKYVAAVVWNKPLASLFSSYQESLKDGKKRSFTFEQDLEDERLFVSKFKGEVKDYTYVLTPKSTLSFSPGLKTEMLKRINSTFLRSSIYSNKKLQGIKKLETRKEIIWALGLEKKNKDVGSFFLSVDSVNGQIVTELNILFKKVEQADTIFRMADKIQNTIVEKTAKTKFSKFFTGEWLKFDVHSGTFKVSLRFSENLLGKHLPKLSKEINKLSMKDIEGFVKEAQKKQAKAKKKK